MATEMLAILDIDDETAELIFKLQLEDSKKLFEASQAKGKTREGQLSDYRCALQTNQQEMERAATNLKDRNMAASIANAVIADAELIAASRAQEEIALNDRALACRLAGIAPPPLPIAPPPAESNVDDRAIDVMVSKF